MTDVIWKGKMRIQNWRGAGEAQFQKVLEKIDLKGATSPEEKKMKRLLNFSNPKKRPAGRTRSKSAFSSWVIKRCFYQRRTLVLIIRNQSLLCNFSKVSLFSNKRHQKPLEKLSQMYKNTNRLARKNWRVNGLSSSSSTNHLACDSVIFTLFFGISSSFSTFRT